MPFDNLSSVAAIWCGALAMVGLRCQRHVEDEPAVAVCIELLAQGHFDSSIDRVRSWRRPSSVAGKPRFHRCRDGGHATALSRSGRAGSHQSVWHRSAALRLSLRHHGTIQFQIRAQRDALKSLELQKQLSAAHLRALQMQLEPHFLFNTLNAITTLVEFGRTERGCGNAFSPQRDSAEHACREQLRRRSLSLRNWR